MTEQFSNEEIIERKLADKELSDILEELRRSQAEVLALLESSRAALEHREFKDAVQPIFNYCKNFIGAAVVHF